VAASVFRVQSRSNVEVAPRALAVRPYGYHVGDPRHTLSAARNQCVTFVVLDDGRMLFRTGRSCRYLVNAQMRIAIKRIRQRPDLKELCITDDQDEAMMPNARRLALNAGAGRWPEGDLGQSVTLGRTRWQH
jgi:hypothetical protein